MKPGTYRVVNLVVFSLTTAVGEPIKPTVGKPTYSHAFLLIYICKHVSMCVCVCVSVCVLIHYCFSDEQVRPYPRRAFGVSDGSSSLNELGLTSKQEALFLEFI